MTQNDSSNAEAYNHTSAAIIRMQLAWRERGYDSENYGARIT
jgi:hypothetical protein